jgi:hypothetical protein
MTCEITLSRKFSAAFGAFPFEIPYMDVTNMFINSPHVVERCFAEFALEYSGTIVYALNVTLEGLGRRRVLVTDGTFQEESVVSSILRNSLSIKKNNAMLVDGHDMLEIRTFAELIGRIHCG